MPGDPAGHHARRSARTTTWCIVWHPVDVPPPAELLASLRRSDVRVVTASNPYIALARTCLVEARCDGRTLPLASEVTPGDAAVLILAWPRQLEAAADVARVLPRYASRTAFWCYDSEDAPPLRAVTHADIEAWTERRPEPERPISGSRPVLRLTAPEDYAPEPVRPARVEVANAAPAPLVAPVAPAPPVPPSRSGNPIPERTDGGHTEQGRAPASLLTEEELRMLLTDDPTPMPSPAPAGPGVRIPARRVGAESGSSGGGHSPEVLR